MESPKTYSEWIDALEVFISSPIDYKIIDAFKNGFLDWQGGCADRFTKQFLEAINCRIDALNERVSSLSSSSLDNPDQIFYTNLNEIRNEFMYLKEACNLPFIPEDERQEFIDIIISVADQMQSSLEDSCKSDRSGKMLFMCKDNAVNNI